MKTRFRQSVAGKLAFLLFISLISFNCSKETANRQPDPDPVPQTTDVYAGGFERSAAGYSIAKTWKNGVATTLTSDGDDAWVRSITVSGNDVYAVGILIQGGLVTGSEPYLAKLWKNGVEVPILASGDIANGDAYSVVVSGTDLYIAGFACDPDHSNAHAAVWKNGVENALSGPGGSAASVFVSGTDVYVSGDEWNATSNLWEKKYWKNGTANILTPANTFGNNQVGQILVAGNDVYIVGVTESTNTHSYATLWKNGVANNLTDGNGNAGLDGVAIAGNDVYTTGSSTPTGATYANVKVWKNGVATDITPGTYPAASLGITISGSDVYVCGFDWKDQPTLNRRAVVWKNAEPQYLTDGTYQATAYAVAVKTY